MPPITQEDRQIAVATPLGPDVLVLTSFSGGEEISRPFQFNLEMVSAEDSIAPKDIVGKKITVRVRLYRPCWRHVLRVRKPMGIAFALD